MTYQKPASFKLYHFCGVLFILQSAILAAQTPPTLVVPKNNIVTSATLITFEWNTFLGAISYHIQIDDNASFTLPITVNDSSISGTTFSATLISGNKYFWRVRANAGGSYSNWSVVWSFDVFSPSDIPITNPPNPNLVTWYKADFGVTDPNGFVSQWDDASGNNNHAIQNDTALQPLFVASAPEINGYPLIHFPGSKQYLDFTTNLTSVETVFWVVMEDPIASTQYRSLLGDWNDEPDFVRGCCENNSGQPDFPGSVKFIYDDVYPSANDYVKDGTTRVNGAIVLPTVTNMPTTLSIISTRTAGNCQAENFVNDRNEDGGTRVWDGDLAELIIFNEPLTDPQIELVEGYLQDKYAPAVNIGANRKSNKLCDTVTLSVGNYYKNLTWSNGDTSDSVQVSAPGTYWVKAKDQFDRYTYDTIVVEFVRPKLIQPSTICYGDSIIWDTGLSSPYTFLWQDGSSGSSYTIDKSGDYYVTVSDNTGCSYTSDTVHVEVDSFNIIADLGPDVTICQYQSIGLVSGVSMAKNYSWSTGDTTSEIVISVDNNYSLTVTDTSGCVAVDAINIDVGPEAPTVNFNATNACLGFAIDFTDNSSIGSGSTLVGWLWDFGDNATSSLRNPSHTYQASGNYSVRLTVTADNLCTNFEVKTVSVFSLPQALFSDTVFCAGIPRQFFDESTSAASIDSWLWNFGDGGTATIQNPLHQYDSIRFYNVSLKVTDLNQCTDSLIRTVNSVLGVPPADTPGLILPKDEVTLSELPLLFDWQASAGTEFYRLEIAANTSFANPVRSLDAFADSAIVSNLPLSEDYYYWQVLAYNLCGTVTASAIQRFHFFKPDFVPGNCLWLRSDTGVLTNISGTVETILDNSPSSNNASQTNPNRSPEHILNVTELNGKPVIRFDGNDDFIQFQLIDAITTVFWVVKEDSGVMPFYRSLLGRLDEQSDFTRGCCDDGFPGSVKYIYDDQFSKVFTGITRVNNVIVDPVQTDMPTQYALISTSTRDNSSAECFSCDRPFIILNDKRYWDGDLAELIVYCEPLSDEQINTVESYLRNKYAPPVNLGPDITRDYSLCVPAVLRAGDHFVKYNWTVPGMSNIPDTVNSIDFYGSGIVTIEATDVFGFVSRDEMEVKGGLQNPFKDTVFVCLGNDTIWDTRLSHDYIFKWDDLSTDSFHVMNEEKYYWVQVTDSFNCTVGDTVFVNVDSFSILASLGSGDTSLCEGNRIGLVTNAAETVSYLWSTGDTVPVIAVTDSGYYSLTAENIHQCIVHDSMDVDIYGIAPNANFSFGKICFNDSTIFIDSTTPTDIVSWNWDFDDGESDSVFQNPIHFYQDDGTYNVKLFVEDSEGCLQEIIKPVTIYELPITRFSHDLVNCAYDNVEFDDISTAADQTIENRTWSFGDSGSSNAENPLHVFQAEGFYTVSLEVTTNQQCKGIAYDTIEIFPKLVIGFRVENLCIDNTLTCFYDTSPGFSNVSWYWDFGDNTAPSISQNPCHSYIEDGTYVVTLQVKNSIGCTRYTQDTIILADPPIVNFDNPDLCEDYLFRFTDNTITNGGDSVAMWNWDFGDGFFSNEQNPYHAYSEDSLYNVRLSVITNNECSSSAIKAIEVISRPFAGFDFTPEYGAAPLNVSFTNLSADANDYIWNFGDGSPFSDKLNPVHAYLQNGEYLITLISSNLPGCSDTVSQSFDVAVPLVDIGLDKIILTRLSSQSGCLLDMRAIITDYGTVDITSFDINAHNSAGGTIEDHWQGSFQNTRELNYQFSVQFVINDCDNVVICMDIINPNGLPDQNPLNNHLCATLSDDFVIIGPYPNPAGDFINLDLMLPSKGSVVITNYNIMGQKLSVMENAQVEKGYYPVTMETKFLPHGVYILKIEYRDEERVLKYEVK